MIDYKLDSPPHKQTQLVGDEEKLTQIFGHVSQTLGGCCCLLLCL
jgi:hypothetical protein